MGFWDSIWSYFTDALGSIRYFFDDQKELISLIFRSFGVVGNCERVLGAHARLPADAAAPVLDLGPGGVGPDAENARSPGSPKQLFTVFGSLH